MTKTCTKCGRNINDGDIDYIRIQGNIFRGENGGFIGDNIPNISGTDMDADKFRREDIQSTYFCLECFSQEIDEIKRQTIEVLQEKIKNLTNKLDYLKSGKAKVEIPEFLQK